MSYSKDQHFFDFYGFEFSEAVKKIIQTSMSKDMEFPILFEGKIKFLQSFINQPNKMQLHMDKFLKIQTIGMEDLRRDLRGQHGLFAKKLIPKHHIFGIYTGTYLTKEEYGKIRECSQVIAAYAFSTGISENDLMLDGRKSNPLSLINACTTYQNSDNVEQELKNLNTDFFYFRYQGITYVACYATEEIHPDHELLCDYGQEYWEHLNEQSFVSLEGDSKLLENDLLVTEEVEKILGSLVPQKVVSLLTHSQMAALRIAFTKRKIAILNQLPFAYIEAYVLHSHNIRIAVKNVLSSRCPSAILQLLDINYNDEMKILTWYISTASEENKRTAIKDVLSSRCPSAILQLLDIKHPDGRNILMWYISSASEDNKRTAIKDVLSSQCSGAILQLLDINHNDEMKILTWYISTASEDNKRTAIKDVLSSQRSGAILQLLDIKHPDEMKILTWYISTASENNKRAAIKDVLSSGCSGAILQLLDIKYPDGRKILTWYISTASEDNKRTAIKDVLSSYCSGAILQLLDIKHPDGRKILTWYLTSVQDDNQALRKAIKDVLSSECSGAILQLLDIKYSDGRKILTWYISSASEENKRTAIKDVLSSYCSGAILQLLDINYNDEMKILTWYISTASEENKRTAIKDVLSSRCPSAILQLLDIKHPDGRKILTWYISTALENNKRAAIKDVLSSGCSGAILQLLDIKHPDGRKILTWYLTSVQEDNQALCKAIKDVLSSECSGAILQLLDIKHPDGRKILTWYISTASQDDERTVIKDVLSSQCSGAILQLLDIKHPDGRKILTWYLTSVQEDTEVLRKAIKDVLSSDCSGAILQLLKIAHPHKKDMLAWYLTSVQEDTEVLRTAIKDVLSSQCSGAILQLLKIAHPHKKDMLAWYLTSVQEDTEVLRKTIKDILSSYCPDVIKSLIEMNINGENYIQRYLIDVQSDPNQLATAINDIFCSRGTKVIDHLLASRGQLIKKHLADPATAVKRIDTLLKSDATSAHQFLVNEMMGEENAPCRISLLHWYVLTQRTSQFEKNHPLNFILSLQNAYTINAAWLIKRFVVQDRWSVPLYHPDDWFILASPKKEEALTNEVPTPINKIEPWFLDYFIQLGKQGLPRYKTEKNENSRILYKLQNQDVRLLVRYKIYLRNKLACYFWSDPNITTAQRVTYWGDDFGGKKKHPAHYLINRPDTPPNVDEWLNDQTKSLKALESIEPNLHRGIGQISVKANAKDSEQSQIFPKPAGYEQSQATWHCKACRIIFENSLWERLGFNGVRSCPLCNTSLAEGFPLPSEYLSITSPPPLTRNPSPASASGARASSPLYVSDAESQSVYNPASIPNSTLGVSIIPNNTDSLSASAQNVQPPQSRQFITRLEDMKLPNLTATCYINASLQAIFNSPRLYQLLLDASQKPTSAPYFRDILSIREQPFETRKLTLTHFFNYFVKNEMSGMGGHEATIFDHLDAEEFFLKFFNALLPNEASQLLGIVQNSELKCLACNAERWGHGQRTPILNLSLPEGQAHLTFNKLLTHHIKIEYRNDILCPQHNSNQPHNTKEVFTITSDVSFIVLQLKRYLSTHTLGTEKIRTPLFFSGAHVKFVNEDNSAHIFKITAVVVHQGNVNSGHYYTVTPEGVYNDEQIIKNIAPWSQVLTTGKHEQAEGFLYFLERVNEIVPVMNENTFKMTRESRDRTISQAPLVPQPRVSPASLLETMHYIPKIMNQRESTFQLPVTSIEENYQCTSCQTIFVKNTLFCPNKQASTSPASSGYCCPVCNKPMQHIADDRLPENLQIYLAGQAQESGQAFQAKRRKREENVSSPSVAMSSMASLLPLDRPSSPLCPPSVPLYALPVAHFQNTQPVPAPFFRPLTADQRLNESSTYSEEQLARNLINKLFPGAQIGHAEVFGINACLIDSIFQLLVPTQKDCRARQHVCITIKQSLLVNNKIPYLEAFLSVTEHSKEILQALSQDYPQEANQVKKIVALKRMSSGSIETEVKKLTTILPSSQNETLFLLQINDNHFLPINMGTHAGNVIFLL